MSATPPSSETRLETPAEMERRLRKTHIAQEIAPHALATEKVLQLETHLGAGGTMRWVKQPSRAGGEEMTVAFFHKDGRRYGEPGKDVRVDFGPVEFEGLFPASPTGMGGDIAAPGQWSLDILIRASTADTSAPPGTTAHALGTIQHMYGEGKTAAAYELKCLWDPKTTPATHPYFVALKTGQEKFASWCAMRQENDIAAPTPCKVTRKGEGVPVISMKGKIVGKHFPRKGQPPAVDMDADTRDYALSCPGGEASPEFEHFKETIGTAQVRLPTLVSGGKRVPAAMFRECLDGVGPMSEAFVEGCFKSWKNPQKKHDPFFRFEPTALTIIKAVPQGGAGGGAGVPVDYSAINGPQMVPTEPSDDADGEGDAEEPARKRKKTSRGCK